MTYIEQGETCWGEIYDPSNDSYCIDRGNDLFGWDCHDLDEGDPCIYGNVIGQDPRDPCVIAPNGVYERSRCFPTSYGGRGSGADSPAFCVHYAEGYGDLLGRDKFVTYADWNTWKAYLGTEVHVLIEPCGAGGDGLGHRNDYGCVDAVGITVSQWYRRALILDCAPTYGKGWEMRCNEVEQTPGGEMDQQQYKPLQLRLHRPLGFVQLTTQTGPQCFLGFPHTTCFLSHCGPGSGYNEYVDCVGSRAMCLDWLGFCSTAHLGEDNAAYPWRNERARDIINAAWRQALSHVDRLETPGHSVNRFAPFDSDSVNQWTHVHLFDDEEVHGSTNPDYYPEYDPDAQGASRLPRRRDYIPIKLMVVPQTWIKLDARLCIHRLVVNAILNVEHSYDVPAAHGGTSRLVGSIDMVLQVRVKITDWGLQQATQAGIELHAHQADEWDLRIYDEDEIPDQVSKKQWLVPVGPNGERVPMQQVLNDGWSFYDLHWEGLKCYQRWSKGPWSWEDHTRAGDQPCCAVYRTIAEEVIWGRTNDNRGLYWDQGPQYDPLPQRYEGACSFDVDMESAICP